MSIQAQVVNLLQDLQEELGLSYLFISHDSGWCATSATGRGVLRRGRIVELADSDTLYEDPRHPYTRALLGAVPVPDPAAERARLRAMREAQAVEIPEAGALEEVAPGIGWRRRRMRKRLLGAPPDFIPALVFRGRASGPVGCVPMPVRPTPHPEVSVHLRWMTSKEGSRIARLLEPSFEVSRFSIGHTSG